jgi:hypothetical protein
MMTCDASCHSTALLRYMGGTALINLVSGSRYSLNRFASPSYAIALKVLLPLHQTGLSAPRQPRPEADSRKLEQGESLT